MSNHIDDKPVQAIARAIRHNLHPFMRLAFESGKQHESVAVWLVGMSTGAIALIISQFGKLRSSLHFFSEGKCAFPNRNNCTWVIIQDIPSVLVRQTAIRHVIRHHGAE